MFGTGSRFQVAKVRGIPIYASWSWVALAAFFMFGWYSQFSGEMEPKDALRLAALTAVLFFGGILLHEGAHAVAARSFDLPGRAITLVFWGGAPVRSQTSSSRRRARVPPRCSVSDSCGSPQSWRPAIHKRRSNLSAD